MKLLILLICILLQTFSSNFVYDRFRPFDYYISWINPLLVRLKLTRGWGAIFGVLAPALLLILIFNLIFSHLTILYLVYGTLVLFFCLDVRDMKTKLAGYFGAMEAENQAKAQLEAEKFTHHTLLQNTSQMIRGVTEAIFTQSLTNIFSVIFWFFVLGPFGATLYYLIAALSDRAEHSEVPVYDSSIAANYLKDILDWIPARLVTLTYALIGHFGPVFSHWMERLGDGVAGNKALLVECGLTALGIDIDPLQAHPQENAQSFGLVSRTLWTWVIVIAVLYVAKWLF